jgi:hypothetical protein
VDPRDPYLPLSDPTVAHANQCPKGYEPMLPSISVCLRVALEVRRLKLSPFQ